MGIKLFVYVIYYDLFKLRLLKSTYEDPYTPPDFKWIHPEEVLLFFWTEPALLRKINLFINQADKEPIKEELLAEVQLLTHLFVFLYERYFSHRQGFVRFIPSPLSELTVGFHIIEKLKKYDGSNLKEPFLQMIHPHFLQVLQKRLELE